MAFSGHTTPQVVINSTANANPYTGTITVGGPSDLVVLFVHGWTPGSGGEVPTTWTVTLDGSAITPTDHASSSAVSNGVAIYELTGLSAGSHALSVAYPAAGRACQALAWVISGHDAATPVANRAIATTYNSDVASRGYSTTTSRDGNVILSMVGVRRYITTSEFSLSGGTLIGADATPAGSDTNDVTMAYGYHEVATAGSVTDTYSWTEAGRVHLPFVEVNIATGGGGITGTASGSADVTGAATGTVAIQGAASGAADVTGAATGKVAITGTASGSADVTGAATGIVGASVFGTASGEAGVTGSATGKVRVAGTASGQAGVTGAATGKVLIKGVATGQAGVTGSATGSALSAITGTATGEAGVTGTATGVIGAVSLRRQAYGYESANGGRVIAQANGGAFGPSRTGGTFAATANGGKLQG